MLLDLSLPKAKVAASNAVPVTLKTRFAPHHDQPCKTTRHPHLQLQTRLPLTNAHPGSTALVALLPYRPRTLVPGATSFEWEGWAE